MRVHLVSYIDPVTARGRGGGEAVLRQLLEHARRRGHELTGTHVLPRPRFDAFDADLHLLADVWNQPGHRRRVHRRVLTRVPGSALWRYARRVEAALDRPFAHFDNAYVDICDLPYLPCNGQARGPSCPYKQGADDRCFAQVNRRMYENAAVTVFVSPLHRRTVLGRLEMNTEEARALVCRPIIDTAPLRAAGRTPRAARPIEHLYLGPLVEAKGLDEVRRVVGVERVTAVGQVPRGRWLRSRPKPDLDFAEVLPPVAPEQVPALLGSAKRVVTLPRWPEPQGRVALEAALAGCELVANDRVGALSFELDPLDERLYEGAADELWDRLEQVVR